MSEYEQYMMELNKAREKKALNMGWTAIDEQKPKDGEMVLFGCFGEKIETGLVSYGYCLQSSYPGWHIKGEEEQVWGVTHWMKLPSIALKEAK